MPEQMPAILRDAALPNAAQTHTPMFLFIRFPSGVDDEKLTDKNRAFADDLEARLVTFQEAIRLIDRAETLTEVGKGQARLVAAQKAMTGVVAQEEIVTRPIKGERDAASRILTPAFRHQLPDEIDADDARVQGREIRDRFYSLSDDNERAQLYLSAARAGDALTVRSVELAPPTFAIVDEKTVAVGAELFAKATRAERYARLEEVENTLAIMKHNVMSAIQWIETISRHLVAPEPRAAN